MSTTDEPIPEPLPDDGQAAASAESVQGIYAALSPEALDREVDATPGPFVDDVLLAAQKVHVVLVAHDGERWLPQSLESLNRVDAVLESVVAVDTGSRDATAELLGRSTLVTEVVHAERTTGFPVAVAAGCARLPESDDATHEWVWLLHDDCAPEPSCLRELLSAALVLDAAVVGPKVVDWAGTRLLLELGVSITGSGRRYTGIEPREYDQGQHDDRRDVLAVGTAAMLVRRDVWDALGGLDPQIDLFRDDVDFGWRARLAGYRVVVEPRAVVRHAAAAAAGRRRPDASTHRAALTDRRNAVHVLLANASRLGVGFVLARTIVGTLLRAIGFVIGKVPALAADELVAVAEALRPSRVRTARRWRAGTPRTGSVAGLRPTLGTQLRHTVENAGALLAGGSGQDIGGGRRRAMAAGEADEEQVTAAPPVDTRLAQYPGLWLVLIASVVTIVGARTILFAGDLFGGALLPAPSSGRDWWTAALAGWHPVGLGSGAPAPPYLPVLATMSVPLLGNASLLVSVLLIGAVPASVATSWWALHGVVRSTAVRAWAALTYGAVVLATGAVAAGRVGTAVVAAAAPLMVRLVVRALTPGAPLRRAWAAALGLGLTAVFAPIVWVVVVVAAALGALAWSRSIGTVLRWAVLVVVPPLLALPWLPALLRRPELIVAEAGLTGQGGELSDPSLPPWAPVLLTPGGAGSVEAGVLAGLVVLAVVALLVSTSATVRVAWLLTLAAVGAGIATSRVAVGTPEGEALAAGWPGPAVVLAGAGAVLATAAAAPTIRAGSSRVARLAAGGVAVLTTVAALALGLTGSVVDPLGRADPRVLPVYIADEAAGPDRVSTLVLTSDRSGATTSVEFTVLRDDAPRLGDAEVLDPAGDALLAPLVSDVVAGRGEFSATRLADVGIRYVLVPPPGDGVLVEALDGQPGLVRASAPLGGAVWRVDGPSARVRLLDAAGDVVGTVPSGAIEVDTSIDAPGATAVHLAELADAGWRASLDGVALTPSTHSAGLQAFTLPADSGELRIWFENPDRSRLLVGQAVAAVLVVVLMLPPVRRRRDTLVEGVQ